MIDTGYLHWRMNLERKRHERSSLGRSRGGRAIGPGRFTEVVRIERSRHSAQTPSRWRNSKSPPSDSRNPIPERRFFANLSPGLCDEPYDAGLVVIDLVARLVVVDSTYSSPGPKGVVWYHDGRCCTNTATPVSPGRRLALFERWRPLEACWPKSGAESERRSRFGTPARCSMAGPCWSSSRGNAFAAFARRDEIAAAVRAQWAEACAKSPGGRSQPLTRRGGCRPADRRRDHTEDLARSGALRQSVLRHAQADPCGLVADAARRPWRRLPARDRTRPA